NCNLPSWVDPDCEIIRIVQKNVETLRGFRPQPIVSLGGTDARLWRYRNIQACVYGPFPHGMGSFDEYVDIEDFLHIVRTHALSACDFLSEWSEGGGPLSHSVTVKAGSTRLRTSAPVGVRRIVCPSDMARFRPASIRIACRKSTMPGAAGSGLPE